MNDNVLEDARVAFQLDPERLSQLIVENNEGVKTTSGSIAIQTGTFTGRSPKDRFIVKDELTKELVDWGTINQPIDPQNFSRIKKEKSTPPRKHPPLFQPTPLPLI